MISLNTNFSSLIAQSSLKNSTNILNQAVERMSTGYKINHAKDNAANYSIATNMTTKLNAYDVAADNVAMGMDLVTTAMDIVSMMQDRASRLQALSTQARNGTYGAQSLDAINAEANALISEITRLYTTAEYNGVSLFNRKAYETPEIVQKLKDEVVSKKEYNNFISNPKTYTDTEINGMASISEVKDAFTETKYKILSVQELVKLAELTNAGVDTTNIEFVLANDIDLAEWCKEHENEGGWVPIGTNSKPFNGVFDGNGNIIRNLEINSPTKNYQGLFGAISYSAILKNIGICEGEINARNYVGALVGNALSEIENCYSTVYVTGRENVGGLAGYLAPSANNCYSTGNVNGINQTGGLIGRNCSTLTNSYATGNVISAKKAGGLCGYSRGEIDNCYSLGNVKGEMQTGGFIGEASFNVASNCFSGGDVNGISFVGGFIGGAYYPSGTYTNRNIVSLCKVTGEEAVGDFLGGVTVKGSGSSGKIKPVDCFSLKSVGSFIGGCYEYTSSYTLLSDYDASDILSGISAITLQNIYTNLFIGIESNNSSQITFDANFKYDLSVLNKGIESEESLQVIDDLINQLSEKSTILGAVQNRLESALDSIEVNINNLASSRSTIRDADLAKESATYIQQQILQQAAATLMSTANQSPAIALQLI